MSDRSIQWASIFLNYNRVFSKLNRLQKEALTEAICHLDLYDNLNKSEAQYKDVVSSVQDEWPDILKQVHNEHPNSNTDRQTWWEQKGRAATAILLKELLSDN